MKRLAILGASGHGKVVAEIAELNGWSEIVFFDDDSRKQKLEKWLVNGGIEMLLSQLANFDGCIVAIGDNKVRAEKSKLISSEDANIVTLIHPSAVVSKYSEIAKGSVVMAGSIINPFSKVGLSSIINTRSIIEHDSVLHDYVHISPGVNIAGGVSIGESSWIGIGASIKQNITIGKNVIIGAGSVVVNNIPDSTTAFGIPARVRT
jgi:sugar O-acyltransferase (sialic acid O-acetyltransferase NeuD family)